MAQYDGSIKFDTKVDTGGFNKGTKSVTKQMGSLTNSIKAVGVALASSFVVKSIKNTIEEAEKLQNAMTGLKSIMDGQGRSFAKAKQFINEYTEDGLIPANNAITAYKNLALRGYNTEQIEKVLIALKDSATYGRQASYSLGEAVQSASEGLKNENSILVDNAGVTKNVAKMWQEYAKSIGKTTNNLTQQEKIQAEVNGILEESKFQTGDASNYASTYSGQIARLTQQWLTFKQVMGGAFMTLAQAVLPVLNKIMEALIKVAKVFANVINIIFGRFVKTGDAIEKSVKSATSAITGLGDATETAGKQAQDALAPFDDLNVLQQDTGSGNGAGAGIGGVGGLDATDLGLDSFEGLEEFDEEIDRLTKKVLDFFGITVDEADKVTWSFKDMSNEAKILAGVLLYLAGKKVLGAVSGGLSGISKIFGAFGGSKLGKTILTKIAVPFKEIGAVISGVASGTFTLKEGLALLAGEFGGVALSIGLVGSWLLAFGTAIWGAFELASGGFDKAIEKADLFGDVSKQTKKKMEPFIDALQELGTQTKLISFKEIVTAQDVANIKSNITEITDMLETEVVDKYAEFKQKLSDTELFEDPEKRAEYLTALDEGYKEQLGLIEYYENEMVKIYQTASDEHRNLTEHEQMAVNDLQLLMSQNGIQILSDNEREAIAIQSKFNENYGKLNAQQVADAIAKAKELKDKTIQEANEEYDERVALANELRQTVPTFTDEMYNEMIESAKTARDEQITSANETYKNITDKAQETYPEITQYMDLENGRQLNILELFVLAVKRRFDEVKAKIKEIFGKIYSDISGTWEDIKSSAKSALNYVIDIINQMINGINRVQFNIPNWVPEIGGQYFGINLPTIPRLATGAVIPPNAEFTAILGDQKNGRNLEAPEDLIRQIVREETEALANRPIIVKAQVSGKTLMDIIAEEERESERAYGYNTGGGSLAY